MPKQEQSPPFPKQHDNINLLWAALVIEELTRHGIKDFCIAPGSRSTPLTLAVANHKKAQSHVHFDERGLGFLALGISKSSQRPVVIITTSGTAVANLYPAVIEAKQSQIPLIILSADRPPELIACGANQAIEQHKIFADYPVFFTQFPTPNTAIQASFVLTTLDHGLHQQRMLSGPIHLNMAFAEPFYPTDVKVDYQDYLHSIEHWCEQKTPFTDYHEASQQDPLSNLIDLKANKILVIVGRLQDASQVKVIDNFCKALQLPLFADIQSQLQATECNIAGYDLLLENAKFKELVLQTELIIQFSDHLVSKRLSQTIAQVACPVWIVSEKLQRIDPTHLVRRRFTVTAERFIKQTTNKLPIDLNWLNRLKQFKPILASSLDKALCEKPLNEIDCCRHSLTKTDQQVMIGNSLAIRLADMVGSSQATIYSNRGASGIDGIIATTIGLAITSKQNTTLLIGDTSFLYDLNSLALINNLNTPLVIVLLNNDGGGIFNLLPVPQAEQKKYYQVPHGLSFEHTCLQFNIDYQRPQTYQEFQTLFNSAHHKQGKHCTLLEVCVNNQLTPALLEAIKNEVKNAVIP